MLSSFISSGNDMLSLRGLYTITLGIIYEEETISILQKGELSLF